MNVVRLLTVGFCMLLMVGLTGCMNSFGKTKEERSHLYLSIAESEFRMMMDDIDYINMVERRSRLTRWH